MKWVRLGGATLGGHAGGLKKLIKIPDINSDVQLDWRKESMRTEIFLRDDWKIQKLSDKWQGLRLKDHYIYI